MRTRSQRPYCQRAMSVALHALAFLHGVGQGAQQHLRRNRRTSRRDARAAAFPPPRGAICTSYSQGVAGRGALRHGGADVLEGQGGDERRGQVLFHLPVPAAQQRHHRVQRGGMGFAAVVGGHQLAAPGNGRSWNRRPSAPPADLRPASSVRAESRLADLQQPVRRREIAVDGIGRNPRGNGFWLAVTIMPPGGLKAEGNCSKGMKPSHSNSPDAPSTGTSPDATAAHAAACRRRDSRCCRPRRHRRNWSRGRGSAPARP